MQILGLRMGRQLSDEESIQRCAGCINQNNFTVKSYSIENNVGTSIQVTSEILIRYILLRMHYSVI